jgi:hypothetical protein
MANARAAFQISKHGISNFLRQWKTGFDTPLASNTQGSGLPLEVIKSKLSYITRAKSQSGQHQHDRPTTEMPNGVAIINRYQTVNFLGREATR